MSRRDQKVLRRARQAKGRRCYICGEDGAEMHHLIPLWMGGEDSVNNMIPLCTWHHMLMHKATSQRKPNEHKHVNGRPKMIDGIENYKEILDDYIECRIGHAECRRRLGVSSASHIKDAAWFKGYLKERGISSCRNRVDYWRGRLKGGEKVGYIEYENGERQEFYWRAA